MNAKSLYIHIPFCKRKCPYCNFFSTAIANYDTDKYLDAVIEEIKRLSIAQQQIETIYIGGGTPTLLPLRQLLKLTNFLSDTFTKVTEFTIEANPYTSIKTSICELSSHGINRLSLGVQSFSNEQLKLLERNYNFSEIIESIDSANKAGIDNVSIDLMFALPGSSLRSWIQDLKIATSLGVKHISAYSLSYEKNTRFMKMLNKGELSAIDERIDKDMYAAAIEILGKAGFNHYEISNFAKNGFECKHNLTYWNGLEYFGAGAAAGSFYAMKRRENIADIERYIELVKTAQSPRSFSEKLTAEDYARQTAILMLRQMQGIKLEIFQKQTSYNFLSFFEQAIIENIRKGFLELTEDYCRLSPKALPIADSVLCDFV